jgi:DNA-binding PadR family transcriptional regulator
MQRREVTLELYKRELLKGSTETLILFLVSEVPIYGYQLVKEMEIRSSGYFHLKEGTLYPALHRLERDGLVESTWEDSPTGQSRRYYRITVEGEEKLHSMLQEWDLFTRAVNLVAKPVLDLAKGVLKSR